jgi:ribosome-associated protein
MERSEQIRIRGEIAIPLSEIHFRFSRSSGPGGQHVNRTETQVELLFDVGGSASLSDSQKGRILDKLKGYIDKEGILHLVSGSTRSQSQNRTEVIQRFQELLAWTLRPRKRRRPTKPSRAARERRLAAKKRRSEKKRRREKPEIEE